MPDPNDPESPSGPGPVVRPGPLVNGEFTRLWLAQAVSQFGDFVSGTALMLWIGAVLLAGRPNAPLVSGGLLIGATVVALAVAPWAGVLADRVAPRRLMLAADAFRAVSTALLAVVLLLPALHVPVGVTPLLVAAYLVVALNAAASQCFAPARTVLLGDLVPAERLGRAAGYNQTTYAVLAIAAPALGALLVFTVGMPVTLLIDAASFLLSFAVVRTIRAPAPVRAAEPEAAGERPGWGARLSAGLAVVRRQRAVGALLAAIGLAAAGSSTIDSLTVYFVRDDLHAGGAWFGVLQSADGVGAVLGGLLGGRLGDRAGHGRVYGWMLVGYGVLVLGFARLGAPVPAVALAVLMGAALGALNAVFTPLLLGLVPRSTVGRLSSLVNAVSQTGSLGAIGLSAVLVGGVFAPGSGVTVLGLRFGPLDGVFTVCGLLCAVAGWHVLRRVRDARPSAAEQRQPA